MTDDRARTGRRSLRRRALVGATLVGGVWLAWPGSPTQPAPATKSEVEAAAAETRR